MPFTRSSYNRIPPDVFITLDHTVYNKIAQGPRKFKFPSFWKEHLEQDAIGRSPNPNYAIIWCFYDKFRRMTWFRCFTYKTLDTLNDETRDIRKLHAYAIYEMIL